MECCTIYHGVFGLWGWECMADDGLLIDESHQVFETVEECVTDARKHGYRATEQGGDSESQRFSEAARPGRYIPVALAA